MLRDNFHLSVILCTYNGEKYLNEQIESVIHQSYKIDEFIILDDCSSDSTENIILKYQKKYTNIKYYKNEENLGPIGSFQKAASLASGDYIAFCDQDDIWEKNKMEVQMGLIDDNIKQDVPFLSFHDLLLIDTNNNVISKSFWRLRNIKETDFSFESILFSNIVTGCTCIINKKMKDIFLETNINNIMMHDHWMALIAFGFGQVSYTNKCLIRYRSHSNSVTPKEKTSIWLRIKNILNSIIKNTNEYLNANIKQAEELNKYSNVLNRNNKNALDHLLKLKSKLTLIKMMRPYFRYRKIFGKKNRKKCYE